MTSSQRAYLIAAGLILTCGALLAVAIFGPGLYRIFAGARTPAPDFPATLESVEGQATDTAVPSLPSATAPPGAEPTGRIVYTCQIYKYQSAEQICMIHPDGSEPRQLTQDASVRHYYGSMAPDGQSVVYSQYREDNVYEIYELDLAAGQARRLTDRLGVLTGPEISPDGSTIAFMRWTPAADQYQIWLMDRDGGNPRRLFSGTGWDPTWSPDGSQVLFASDSQGPTQLYVVDVDGAHLAQVSDLPAIRGRSDWSPHDMIVTYSGESWKREIYIMQVDGSDVRQVSPSGGNSQGPTFSPDGRWIAFTAYYDHPNDIHGCEIYIMRTDGTGLRRLTNNDYCDYQPRWGP